MYIVACMHTTHRRQDRERKRGGMDGCDVLEEYTRETRVRILVHLNSLFFFREELPSYVTLSVCIEADTRVREE